jgi:hypothetical protein
MRSTFCACAMLLVLCAPALGAEPYGLVAFSANGVPSERREAAYRSLREAGVDAIRLDIGWTQVEPPGAPLRDFDFKEIDRHVAAIKGAGLKLIGLLAYGHPDYSTLGGAVQMTPIAGGLPPLGTGGAHLFPPDDPDDFARYATAAADHYGDEVMAWEVWNEENAGVRFWSPREDPAAYAELLCRAHDALKKVDPTTPVLFGGVFFPGAPGGVAVTSGPDFVDAAYRARPGLGGCSDAVAYHPYPYPFTSPEVEVPVRGSVLSAYDQLRVVLERNGDGAKPLWISEVGWPTHDRSYGVPEKKQAQYVGRMQAASFAQGLPVLTWFTYGDFEDASGGYNQEAWFGFFRPDGSAKPAFRALRTFNEVFAGTRFARDRSRELGMPPGEPNAGGRGFALEFAGNGRTVAALWLASESAMDGQYSGSESAASESDRLRLRLPVGVGSVVVVGHLGEPRELQAKDGAVELELAPSPQYVVIDRPGRRPPRLRLRLRYRPAMTSSRRRCAGSRVLARVVGRDRLLVARVAFFRDRRLVARDRRAPFVRVVDRGGHRGRPHRHRIGARALLRDGRRARLRQRFLSCGSQT